MRKWNIKKQDEALVSHLSNAFRCEAFLARILINRGLSDPKEISAFLNTDSSALLDPFLFKDMRRVVRVIGEAIRNGEKIIVYGDYDVDGITSTGLLVKCLRSLGGAVDYYIPSRFTEGYGLNLEAVKKFAEQGAKLLITVDTGITAVSEVEIAKELGMKVIITDHHECQPMVPDTLILNPKYPGCEYPYKELAGVGVAYKLVTALEQTYGDGALSDQYLSFAAIGTIADIMPLHGENRYIVRRGLELLKDTDSVGLRVLIERCVGNKPLDASAIGFNIAPRINAAGRLGNACVGVDLLITPEKENAERVVDELCHENNRRQEIENRILEEAVEMIETDPSNAKRNAIVLWKEDWHNGVVGIVASRLKDRYQKPCILFSINEGFAKGSGRSLRPFNLFDTLQSLSDIPEKFGGHAYAAGVLVAVEKLELFRDAFCERVDRFLEHDRFDTSIDVDCVLHPKDISLDKVQTLDQLAPYGRGNEVPVFCMNNARLLDVNPTANKNHMRLVLQVGNQRITAFYFNMPPEEFCYKTGDLIDLVFELDINNYNNRRSVQFLVKDVRYNKRQADQMRAIMHRIRKGKILKEDIPSRDQSGAVYRFLRRQLCKGIHSFDLFALPAHIEEDQRHIISAGTIYHSLEILKELGILEYTNEKGSSYYSNLTVHSERRVNFADSAILKNIQRKAGESV